MFRSVRASLGRESCHLVIYGRNESLVNNPSSTPKFHDFYSISQIGSCFESQSTPLISDLNACSSRVPGLLAIASCGLFPNAIGLVGKVRTTAIATFANLKIVDIGHGLKIRDSMTRTGRTMYICEFQRGSKYQGFSLKSWNPIDGCFQK